MNEKVKEEVMKAAVKWAVVLVFMMVACPGWAEGPVKEGSTQYGDAFALEEEVSVDDVLKSPEKYADKTIRVRGKITSVCKKKGCWMILGKPDVKDSFIRVRMKDYGFFVPLDCSGQDAAVEGVFTRKLLQEKMVKHYAEDAGKDPAKVSGTRQELSMMASGISIAK